MRIRAALTGDLAKLMEAQITGIEAAVTNGVREAATGLQAELRQQTESAGLGRGLAHSWRREQYPRAGRSMTAAALVFSRAPQVMRAFSEGSLIRSAEGRFLAIPTEAAPARGTDGKRITPSTFPEVTLGPLRYVYRRGRPALLVVDDVRLDSRGRVRSLRTRRKGGGDYVRLTARTKAQGVVGRTTVVMFVLVPQVRLRKRLDIDGAAKRWEARLPGLILRHFPRGEAV